MGTQTGKSSQTTNTRLGAVATNGRYDRASGSGLERLGTGDQARFQEALRHLHGYGDEVGPGTQVNK